MFARKPSSSKFEALETKNLNQQSRPLTGIPEQKATKRRPPSGFEGNQLRPFPCDVVAFLSPDDLVITVEHCTHCDKHGEFLQLNHDYRKYVNNADSYLRALVGVVYKLNLNLRGGIVRKHIFEEKRIGAFEVTVMFRNKAGVLFQETLHSKLESHQWPVMAKVINRLENFLVDAEIPVFEPEKLSQTKVVELQQPASHDMFSEDARPRATCVMNYSQSWEDTHFWHIRDWSFKNPDQCNECRNAPQFSAAVFWVFDGRQDSISVLTAASKLGVVRNLSPVVPTVAADSPLLGLPDNVFLNVDSLAKNAAIIVGVPNKALLKLDGCIDSSPSTSFILTDSKSPPSSQGVQPTSPISAITGTLKTGLLFGDNTTHTHKTLPSIRSPESPQHTQGIFTLSSSHSDLFKKPLEANGSINMLRSASAESLSLRNKTIRSRAINLSTLLRTTDGKSITDLRVEAIAVPRYGGEYDLYFLVTIRDASDNDAPFRFHENYGHCLLFLGSPNGKRIVHKMNIEIMPEAERLLCSDYELIDHTINNVWNGTSKLYVKSADTSSGRTIEAAICGGRISLKDIYNYDGRENAVSLFDLLGDGVWSLRFCFNNFEDYSFKVINYQSHILKARLNSNKQLYLRRQNFGIGLPFTRQCVALGQSQPDVVGDIFPLNISCSSVMFPKSLIVQFQLRKEVVDCSGGLLWDCITRGLPCALSTAIHPPSPALLISCVAIPNDQSGATIKCRISLDLALMPDQVYQWTTYGQKAINIAVGDKIYGNVLPGSPYIIDLIPSQHIKDTFNLLRAPVTQRFVDLSFGPNITCCVGDTVEASNDFFSISDEILEDLRRFSILPLSAKLPQTEILVTAVLKWSSTQNAASILFQINFDNDVTNAKDNMSNYGAKILLTSNLEGYPVTNLNIEVHPSLQDSLLERYEVFNAITGAQVPSRAILRLRSGVANRPYLIEFSGIGAVDITLTDLPEGAYQLSCDSTTYLTGIFPQKLIKHAAGPYNSSNSQLVGRIELEPAPALDLPAIFKPLLKASVADENRSRVPSTDTPRDVHLGAVFVLSLSDDDLRRAELDFALNGQFEPLRAELTQPLECPTYVSVIALATPLSSSGADVMFLATISSDNPYVYYDCSLYGTRLLSVRTTNEREVLSCNIRIIPDPTASFSMPSKVSFAPLSPAFSSKQLNVHLIRVSKHYGHTLAQTIESIGNTTVTLPWEDIPDGTYVIRCEMDGMMSFESKEFLKWGPIPSTGGHLTRLEVKMLVMAEGVKHVKQCAFMRALLGSMKLAQRGENLSISTRTSTSTSISTSASASAIAHPEYIIIVDKSGSMGGHRWSDARKALEVLAKLACKSNPLGITLYFFNTTFTREDHVNYSRVMSLFDSHTPESCDDLGPVLADATKPDKKSTRVPKRIMVITDGMPDDGVDPPKTAKRIEEAIIRAAHQISSLNDLSITFIQIGDDSEANKWLNGLLDGQVKTAKHPIVDVLPYHVLKDVKNFGAMFEQAVDGHYGYLV